jgi:hypothetical protein
MSREPTVSEEIMRVKRKIWCPSTNADTRVVSLPKLSFFEPGDEVEVIAYTDKTIKISRL